MRRVKESDGLTWGNEPDILFSLTQATKSLIQETRMDISDMRRDFESEGLERDALDDNPVRQFQVWFENAREAGILEPNAMSLATSGGDGMPDIRTVLLKYFDDAGFVFYTNYGSRKAHEMAENPKAALLFPLDRAEPPGADSGPCGKGQQIRIPEILHLTSPGQPDWCLGIGTEQGDQLPRFAGTESGRDEKPVQGRGNPATRFLGRLPRGAGTNRVLAGATKPPA